MLVNFLKALYHYQKNIFYIIEIGAHTHGLGIFIIIYNKL